MPAYLVRTYPAHLLVGFFVAANTEALAYQVDEVMDPEMCEYQIVTDGGIYWADSDVKVPISDGTILRPAIWKGTSLTATRASCVEGSCNREWRRLIPDLRLPWEPIIDPDGNPIKALQPKFSIAFLRHKRRRRTE